MQSMNPFMFFHSVQLNDKVDDNTFFGIDLECFIHDRHKIFGQLLIDDYQIEHKERSDNEPNEIGFLLGLQSLNLFDFFDFRGEYLRINNRVYNQFLSRNRYLNRGRLIGNDFGPDGDRWFLTVEKWLSPGRRVGFNLVYQRKGEGGYNDAWSAPWFEEIAFKDKFPSGVVEKKVSGALRFEGYLINYLYINAAGGVEHIINLGHIIRDDRSQAFASFRLTFCIGANLKIQ